jgi:cytidine deaminase
MKKISNQERIEILAIINQLLEEDGCQECVYETRDEWEKPCSICKRSMRDYYRKEINQNERTAN